MWALFALDQAQEAITNPERGRDEQGRARDDRCGDGDEPLARECPAARWMLRSCRVEHVVPAFGAVYSGTPENVIPASHFILELSR